jgi:hypothetical protein
MPNKNVLGFYLVFSLPFPKLKVRLRKKSMKNSSRCPAGIIIHGLKFISKVLFRIAYFLQFLNVNKILSLFFQQPNKKPNRNKILE